MTNRNVLKSGETLNTDDRLTSTNGNYFLVMQGDANFCLYKKDGTCIWQSGVPIGITANRATLQSDGSLVLLWGGPGYEVTWSTNTGGHSDNDAVALVLLNNGNLVLVKRGTERLEYDATGNIRMEAAAEVYWQTNTAGR